jgi:hypothetical protein
MRFLARVGVVAAAVAVLVAGVAPGAEGAGRHGKHNRLRPPTSHVVDHVTCVQVDDGQWDVRAYWRVTGGRYVNLSYASLNEPEPTPGVVRHGEPQIVPGQEMHFHGFPDPATGVTVDMLYQQTIAPIGKANDAGKYRLLSDSQPVTFTC